MTREQKNEYAKLQMQIFLARAQFEHGIIVSGAYKNDKVFHCSEPLVEFTDEEKLQKHVEIYRRHLNFAHDCLDAISYNES